MSTIAKISMKNSVGVAGLGLACVTEGIKELNYAYEKEKELVDCDNKIHKVDLLIKTIEGEEIGVIQTEEGLEFVVKDVECAVSQAAIKKIKQRYSKYMLINELKQKGYSKIKEEKLPNGSIRMVVEKWD